MRRAAIPALALLALCGCGQTRPPPSAAPAAPAPVGSAPAPRAEPPPAADPAPALPAPEPLADEVLRAHGQARAVVSDLLVRIKAPSDDGLLFQLSLWCPADGRIRLIASKLDQEFIQALVQPDGGFTAELVRSHELVRGNLRDITVLDADGKPSGPPFLAYLALLVLEAKGGPLPERGPYRSVPPPSGAAPGARTLAVRDPVSGLTSEVTVAPDGTALAKRILDAPGKEALRFEYGRYQRFDQLNRPTRLHLVVPGDASDYTVRLRKLDAVPTISEERMRFTPSPGDHEITLDEFLKRLRE